MEEIEEEAAEEADVNPASEDYEDEFEALVEERCHRLLSTTEVETEDI